MSCTIPVASADGCDNRPAQRRSCAMDGLIFTTHTFPVPGSAAETFNTEFEQATGNPPEGAYTALGYDAAMLLKAALEKVAARAVQHCAMPWPN